LRGWKIVKKIVLEKLTEMNMVKKIVVEKFNRAENG